MRTERSILNNATTMYLYLEKLKSNTMGIYEKNVLDCKKFWKTVKPFLSDKCPLNEKIIIVENDEIISNDK